MATKTLKTRIQLKYDTYANWTANNPTPLSGGVCVVVIPAATNAVVQEPSVLFKVGDGTTAFNTLPYVGGIAADVYDWAKAANKPTYSAEEITNIDTYISDYVNEQMGISVDTDTQYTIVKVNNYKYKLQSKSKSATSYTDTGVVIDIPKYDDTTLADRVSDLEGLVGNTAVATQIANAITNLNLANTYEPKGAAATEAGKVQTALNEYKELNDGVISAIKDGTSIDSFKDVETALAGKQATGDYATKAQAQGYANAKDTAIAAAKKAGDDAQADVDALAGKVGTVAEGKTVVQMIEEAKTAATYDDTKVKEDIAANADAIKTEKERMDAFMALENGQTLDAALDSLKEIQDYITNEAAEADVLVGKIAAVEAIVDGIGGAGEKPTVVAYVTDAIAALKIGDYAKASELTNLATRVTTAEGKITNLETNVAKKANNADLAAIAKSGNVNDLVQTSGDYIIFNCGSSSEVI